MPEGMAVGLLDGAADRRADMREEQRGTDVAGKLAQVAVVPGRLGAVEHARRVRGAVPTDAEPVAVGGLGPEPRVQALGHERVGPLVERLLDQDGGAGVCEPAAHLDAFLSECQSVLTPVAAPSRQADCGTTCRRALRSD